jgi:hypothetical protein
VGPGYMPSPNREETFDTDEAWCMVTRVGFANNKSRLNCTVTEAECVSDLYTAPNGHPGLFNRSSCRRTSPTEWTPKDTDWNGPPNDAFVCKPEGPKKPAMCRATPGELITPEDQPVPKAWCYLADHGGVDAMVNCFREHETCERDRSESKRRGDVGVDAACVYEGPQRALEGLAKTLRLDTDH